ncbi:MULTISPECIES: alpha/beta fold hydrolase [Rothia]|uniref:alpha/beta fold hydrolase n=1 Tax=Rothia TaxID=32207 RepID=UPI001EFA1045|nr:MULTISPECIES: alpha/beta fold hydrolase [Rothia]
MDELASYPVKTAHLSYGEIAYLDIMPTGSSSVYSDPPVILSLHGIYGGYDQAFENVRELSKHYRIIAPSRFGYPGSAVAGEGSPKEQAAALMALLDILNIEQVYVLGASAGGTPLFVSLWIIRNGPQVLFSSALLRPGRKNHESCPRVWGLLPL